MTPPAPERADRPRPGLTRRALLERWWMWPVAGTLGAFGYMGWYASHVTFGKRRAGAPDFVPGPVQDIAALSDLKAEWAALDFSYGGRPCTVLRVPEAVAGGLSVAGRHYAAYSRVCTHLGCTVNLIRDPEILAFAFNYRPPQGDEHPQLGCRCHFSVFDPLRAGEAVFGKATLPLPRLRLEARGLRLVVSGIEPAPQTTD